MLQDTSGIRNPATTSSRFPFPCPLRFRPISAACLNTAPLPTGPVPCAHENWLSISLADTAVRTKSAETRAHRPRRPRIAISCIFRQEGKCWKGRGDTRLSAIMTKPRGGNVKFQHSECLQVEAEPNLIEHTRIDLAIGDRSPSTSRSSAAKSPTRNGQRSRSQDVTRPSVERTDTNASGWATDNEDEVRRATT